MRKSNLLLVCSLTVLLASCSDGSNQKEDEQKPTKLKPQVTTVNGIFIENFELVDKEYKYEIKMPDSDLSAEF